MIEITFAGESFVQVRKEIQEFAITHLAMKNGVTPESLSVPMASMHTMTQNVAVAPEKRKPGRQPGYSPKKEAAKETQMPLASVMDEEVEVPADVVVPTEEEALSAIQAVQERHGMEKAKKLILEQILPKFGVKRGRDLPPEKRSQFIQMCEQA